MPVKGTPLQPYRPSNGTEGEMFEAKFCDRCTHDEGFRAYMRGEGEDSTGCDIHTNALAFYTDDEHYPREWVFGVDGWPTCTAFRDRNSEPDAPAYVSPDPGQGDLFEPLPVADVTSAVEVSS